MFGRHRRGFDWKEIAEVLHVSRAVTRAAFWREIKRSRSTKTTASSSAIATQEERDRDTVKLPKPGTSR